MIHYPEEKPQKKNGRPTPWGTFIFCMAVYLGIIYFQAIGIFQTTVNGILAQFLVILSVYLAASCGRAGFLVGLSLNVLNLIALLLAVLIDHKAEAITGLVVNLFTIVSISIIGALTSRTQKEIDTRTQTEFHLREALGEKEVLLKEIHHRVKNNLQIISSLLNLQSTHITDQKTREALRESQHRVRSMALIHEKLYQSTDLAQIDFASYLKDLVNSLAQSYRHGSSQVLINTVAQNIHLDLDNAIPCGLIVNELVSNSLKHAFPENNAGHIEVVFEEPAGDEYTLVIRDDGVGLPAGLDPTQSTSLGLKLVASLVQQLNGTLVMDNTNGASFEIIFKKVQ
jgi:two-component sensor histidine kinase